MCYAPNMSAETRYIPPEERTVLKDLPNTTSRGAPKIWEYRLREIIGTEGWHPMAEGPKTSMQAMKSNFKYGRMSSPANHVFECEVVSHEDPEKDNLAILYFRWLREETEEDRQDAARLKLEARLAELEAQHGTAASSGGVDTGDDEPEPAVADHLVVGDPHGDREPLVDPEPVTYERQEEEEALAGAVIQPDPPFTAPTAAELDEIESRTVPVEDPNDVLGLEDL